MALYYTSISMLQERMTTARVTDLCAGLTGTPQTTFLTNVLTRAEDMVNAYGNKLYVTPFNIPNDSSIIVEWTLRIAEYELYKRGGDSEVPKKYKDSYDEVFVQLKDMAAGSLVPEGVLARKNTRGISIDIDSNVAMFDETSFTRF